MYKIIGADGKEYGPISLEQLKQWVAEGRLNQQSKVLPDGNTDWKTVAQLPELANAMPPLSPLPTVPDQAEALRLVKGPGIFILVLAILNILASILGLFWGAFESQFMEMQGGSEEMIEFQRKFSALFSLPANLLGLVLAIVTLIGALKMMKLQSYGLAMTTAIIMLIPCGTCCCFLNIGAAIWALIVLCKPEVKAAFK